MRLTDAFAGGLTTDPSLAIVLACNRPKGTRPRESAMLPKRRRLQLHNSQRQRSETQPSFVSQILAAGRPQRCWIGYNEDRLLPSSTLASSGRTEQVPKHNSDSRTRDLQQDCACLSS